MGELNPVSDYPGGNLNRGDNLKLMHRLHIHKNEKYIIVQKLYRHVCWNLQYLQ